MKAQNLSYALRGRHVEISANVIHPEAGHTRKRDIKSAFLRLFRSTTSYDNIITLALIYTILNTFLFLILDLGSYSPYYSSLS
jgi:hypothetical protein